MGLLIDGVWSQAWYDTAKTDGRFVRETAHFRNWITPDGTAGPRAPVDLPPRAAAIIFMSHMPVHGRIALLFFGI